MKQTGPQGQDSFAKVAEEVFGPYRTRFERVLVDIIPTLGEDVPVRKAIEYALTSGGKRLRPAIVWMVAEALRVPHSVDLAAIAVEFFHTSSLITDDLPCMDNDDFRRGVPTTHKVFPESVAIMASFALTAAGFELITRISLPPERESLVLKPIYRSASLAIGLQGLIGGQQLDLEPKGFDIENITTIIDLKTGALFDVCFVFGWLFGGGAPDKLDQLHALSRHFGRAFQILDDIDDLEQDRAAGKRINYALLFGLEAARKQVRDHVNAFEALAAELGLGDTPLVLLARMMGATAEQG